MRYDVHEDEESIERSIQRNDSARRSDGRVLSPGANGTCLPVYAKAKGVYYIAQDVMRCRPRSIGNFQEPCACARLSAE